MKEILNTALAWVIANPFEFMTGVVTVCAAIAAATPTPKDDGFAAKMRKVVDLLAMNWGHATNKRTR